MKKEIVYYRAMVRDLGQMINYGIIKAEMSEEKVTSLEGRFTKDILKCRFDGKNVYMSYYTRPRLNPDWTIVSDVEDIKPPFQIVDKKFKNEKRDILKVIDIIGLEKIISI